ncbi:conserved hypothetical protein [Vibrio phage 275E43-1]|nr:conserved hypothetical protein [Vibrio phage 275E43-1]
MAKLMSKVGMDEQGNYVRVGDSVRIEMGSYKGQIAVISGFMPASYSNQTVALLRTGEGAEHRFITRILRKTEACWS